MKGRFMSQLSELIEAYEKEYDALMENVRIIKDNISEASLYEQLAEECCELAHACLKKARVLRGENPTPVTSEQASQNVIEELTDICVASEVLGLYADTDIFWDKMERWAGRIVDANLKNSDA